MRLSRHLDAQSIDRGVGAAKQRPQIRAAEREVHRLFGKPDRSDVLAVGSEYPDAARSGAEDTAESIDLQAVRYAGLVTRVHVGENAPAHHLARCVDVDGVDV